MTTTRVTSSHSRSDSRSESGSETGSRTGLPTASSGSGSGSGSSPVDRSPVNRSPRRRWPWWLAAFLVAALLGGAAYVAYRTPLLGLHSVQVTARSGDLDPELREAVVESVAVPTGTPLVGIDLAAVRRRVLAVPQVSGASVGRHWPNDLVITVTVREAVAVTRANGALYLLDATGAPYLTVAKAPAGLLTVELATPAAGDPATMAALSVVRSLRSPVRQLVASVSAPSAYAVTLELADGRTVLWGSPDEGAEKMQILPALLAQPANSYDISDPTYVTTRG